MKSTRFWMLLLAAVILVSAGAAAYLSMGAAGGVVANIYQGGTLIDSIDLSQVKSGYTIEISGQIENIVRVEKGRVCVEEATCPDQICVHQGWISDSAVPIVCLPNRLVIQIEDTPKHTVDGIAR